MRVKRIYGALNVEFEGGKCANFAIMDRECDRCMHGGCDYCEDVGKPWNEYYQLMKYDLSGFEKTIYERDQTEAIQSLVRLLQGFLNAKEDEELCAGTVR